jgi:hypothetical protein
MSKKGYNLTAIFDLLLINITGNLKVKPVYEKSRIILLQKWYDAVTAHACDTRKVLYPL